MIKCPIVNKDIDIGDCVSIVNVVDGRIKEEALSQEILKEKNWKEICKNCEYHDS